MATLKPARLRREASTQPAVPPPAIRNSNVVLESICVCRSQQFAARCRRRTFVRKKGVRSAGTRDVYVQHTYSSLAKNPPLVRLRGRGGCNTTLMQCLGLVLIHSELIFRIVLCLRSSLFPKLPIGHANPWGCAASASERCIVAL